MRNSEDIFMKQKRYFFNLSAVLALAVTAGCTTYVTPDPIPGYPETAKSIAVPCDGPVKLFYENRIPVTISSKGSADAARILKQKTPGLHISFVSGKKRGDIQLMVRSQIKQVTPEPECRLKSNISVESDILPPWKSVAESGSPRNTRKAADAALRKALFRTLDSFINNILLKEVKKNYRAAIVRFHSVDSIEELKRVCEILSAIDGVKKVSLIENNRGKQIVSFRIFYKNTFTPQGIKNAFIEKQKEMDR